MKINVAGLDIGINGMNFAEIINIRVNVNELQHSRNKCSRILVMSDIRGNVPEH